MHCGWLRCHVVWFETVVWGELEDDLVIRTTQIYSVLHSTTKYYSGTTLYYTVLLQYYSVLQKYYSSTNSVLQSTTPVLLCTRKYYSSTTPAPTPVPLCTTCTTCTTKYYSSTALYYKVLLQYYSVLQSTTPVLVCTTMRRATGLILQPHQILRLPRKMTLMIDVRHT